MCVWGGGVGMARLEGERSLVRDGLSVQTARVSRGHVSLAWALSSTPSQGLL